MDIKGVEYFTEEELSNDRIDNSVASDLLQGFLQMRPTLTFIPGSFLAEKAMSRFPTPASFGEQAERIALERIEHASDLPQRSRSRPELPIRGTPRGWILVPDHSLRPEGTG